MRVTDLNSFNWLPPRMGRVLQLMEDALLEDLDLATLARAAAYSPFHFSRVFGQHFNATPIDFFRQRRLARTASRLRQEHNWSIGDIAAQCGYGGYHAFAKQFRQHYGMSASEWRFENGWRDFMSGIVQHNSTLTLASAVPSVFETPAMPHRPAALSGRIETRYLNATAVYSRYLPGAADRASMLIAARYFMRETAALATEHSRYLGKFYDDPGLVPRGQFCYELALTHPKPGAASRLWPAGMYACMPYLRGYPLFRTLYELWLEQQGFWVLDSGRPHLRCFPAGRRSGWLGLPIRAKGDHV